MTDYAVLWADVARKDLEEIANYIVEERGVDAALRVVGRIEDRCSSLITMPKRGVVVPELRDIGFFQYRQITEKPWRVFYRVQGETVFVVAVVDARRDIFSFLMERVLRL